MITKQFDRMIIGIVAGTLLPIITFFILYVIFSELNDMGFLSGDGFSSDFRVRTISLVSIAANVILVRYFQTRYAYQAVRGVVFPTFVYIIGWIVYFLNFLL